MAGLLPLAACGGPQSALDPAGPVASGVNVLGWWMIGGAAAILALVILAIAIAIFRGRLRARIGGERAVIGGGVILPLLVLPPLLVAGLLIGRGLASDETTPTVRVTGEQFWWRVDYLAPDGSVQATTANEIRLAVGIPVRLVLESADVIHSFWVPALGGKLDMIPGRSNTMTIAADRAGIFRGQCAEFCGDQHALMAFMVIAEEPAAFNAWLTAEAGPAIAPSDAGAAAFIAAGCGACHGVRGTAATGTIGPDLTHLGSRTTIAAGTLPNDQPSRVAWIAGAQAIKPGSRMPSFTELPAADIEAIAAYLGALR